MKKLLLILILLGSLGSTSTNFNCTHDNECSPWQNCCNGSCTSGVGC